MMMPILEDHRVCSCNTVVPRLTPRTGKRRAALRTQVDARGIRQGAHRTLIGCAFLHPLHPSSLSLGGLSANGYA